MVNTMVDREAKAVAAKIVNLVIKAEDKRLTDSGANRAAIREILVNGTIIALVGVFRTANIGNEEELVKALRECLRNFDDFIGKQPRQ
jgi:hypothetical protein